MDKDEQIKALQAEVERLKDKWATHAGHSAKLVEERIAAEAKAESIRRETIEACAEVADKRYFAFHAATDIRALAAGEAQSWEQ